LAEPKERVAEAIDKALTSLDEALAELAKLPAFDAGSMALDAHALNNYLTVTTATLELALMRLVGHADGELLGWLHGAQHATDLMACRLSRLMNPDAPADGSFRFETFDLPTMVQRASSYYQRVADRKQIRLAVGPALGVPPVRGDRVAVAAILDNLLSNAIKYSPPGTTIRPQVRADGDWIVCAVQDSGPGLSPEDQARLFQRGTRLTPRPTAGESSTGYGLAVAKELVEVLGGQIWCESVVGQGSCFAFRLPANPTGGPSPRDS
jgi:two-component system sensor histidine kinase/response regulator